MLSRWNSSEGLNTKVEKLTAQEVTSKLHKLLPVHCRFMLVFHVGSRHVDSITLEPRVLRRLLAIKDDADLLECDVLRFWVCEVDHEDLEDNNGAYDDVVSGSCQHECTCGVSLN
jgi:hypothetical protein